MGFEQDLIDAIRRKNGLKPEGGEVVQNVAESHALTISKTLSITRKVDINDIPPLGSLRMDLSEDIKFHFHDSSTNYANTILYQPRLFVVPLMMDDSYVVYDGARVTSNRLSSIADALCTMHDIQRKINPNFNIHSVDGIEQSYRDCKVGLFRDKQTGEYVEVIMGLDKFNKTPGNLQPFLDAAKGIV